MDTHISRARIKCGEKLFRTQTLIVLSRLLAMFVVDGVVHTVMAVVRHASELVKQNAALSLYCSPDLSPSPLPATFIINASPPISKVLSREVDGEGHDAKSRRRIVPTPNGATWK